MAFIEKVNRQWQVNSSVWEEDPVISGFLKLIGQNGFPFDDRDVFCGVSAGPDFGYFALASRFWRASLCIYFSGTAGCFWERGTGYTEPWLFNMRHSSELYMKGFVLYAAWFGEVQRDILSSGSRRSLRELKEYFKKPHSISEIYDDYRERLHEISGGWHSTELPDVPDLQKMLLSDEGEKVLREVADADPNSFRFRYPSLRTQTQEKLQELGWMHDESMLLPITGLPKQAGYSFNHIQVINAIHGLMQEITSIETYLKGCWSYIGEAQDMRHDIISEMINWSV